MRALNSSAESGVCPCSGWEDCDHHACCEGCPDKGEFWCGACWSRQCFDHNIRDMVELLAEYESEGRPRSYIEPIVKFIEDWRGKYGNKQEETAS